MTPARLVHTEGFDPGTVGGEFPTEDGITTITTAIDFGSKDARDAAVKTGMTSGMEQSYQLLDRLLQEPVL